DQALLESPARGAVGEEPEGYAEPGQLPGRQPGALGPGPRLEDQDAGLQPLLVGRPHDAESGAVIDRRQGTGVACGDDPPPLLEQGGAQAADPAAGVDALAGDRVRLLQRVCRGGDAV